MASFGLQKIAWVGTGGRGAGGKRSDHGRVKRLSRGCHVAAAVSLLRQLAPRLRDDVVQGLAGGGHQVGGEAGRQGGGRAGEGGGGGGEGDEGQVFGEGRVR